MSTVFMKMDYGSRHATTLEFQHMRFPNLLALLIVCGSLTVSIAAQDEVRLTVSVTGIDGAPVLDLKKTDFSVQDGGKQATVGDFVSPQTSLAIPEISANEYSNAPDASKSGAIFVVFDTIHTRYLDERNMREMVLKFLGRAAQAKHAVGLAILNNKGLHIYHDYQTGSSVLLAALIKAGLGGMRGATSPSGVDDAEVAAEASRLTAFSRGDLSNPTPEGQLMRSNIDIPLAMFQDVGHAVYGLPGRKTLVWVTNAVPFDIDPKTFQFASPKESNFGVPVNGAQVGGMKDVLSNDQIKRLMPVWRRSMRALFDGGMAVCPVEAQNSSTAGSDVFTQARMKTLAQLTGGKAFYGGNDPFPEILQTSNGNVAGYVLYLAGESNTKPDFRHLQVTVNKGGSVVSAPAGYFPAEGTLKSRAQEDVTLALQSPLAYTGVVFTLKIAGSEDSGGKRKVNMVIALGGNSGVLNEATSTVDLALFAAAIDASGTTVGKLNENAGGKFPPEAVAQIKEVGFQLKRSMEVPSGNFTLHFVVRDNLTGRIGSLTAPLNVK
jgi:VWFA-related protein